MLKRILAFGVILGACLIAFFTLVNIKQEDVVAFHKLKAHVGSKAFQAGDLVRISADGQEIQSTLCSMSVEEGDLRKFPLSKEYSNSLYETLPDFAALMNWGKSLVGMGNDEPLELDRSIRLPFVGQLSAIRDETVQPTMTSECACLVAHALIQRSKVCSVQASLVETKLRPKDLGDPDSELEMFSRTIGVTFDDDSVIIHDISRMNCPGSSNWNMDAAGLDEPYKCSKFGRHAVDVMVRNKLGFIHEAEYVPDTN